MIVAAWFMVSGFVILVGFVVVGASLFHHWKVRNLAKNPDADQR
jgi:hypothetical protein